MEQRSYMETILMTPTLATEWLATLTLDRQRNINVARIADYAADIKAGKWRTSIIEVRILQGKRYLVNGQHRLRAVINAGIPVYFDVITRIVDTERDLYADYAVIDRQLPRSTRQIIRAVNLASDLGMTEQQAGRLTAAMLPIASGFTASYARHDQARTVNGRMELARAWNQEAIHAFATIGEGDKPRIRTLYTVPVFSVALVTFRFQPEKAEIFWQKVATMVNLTEDDPAYTLAEYLMRIKVHNRIYANIWKACARTWNAYFTNRSLRYLKMLEGNDPIEINGTPYTGSEVITLENLPTVESWNRKPRSPKARVRVVSEATS